LDEGRSSIAALPLSSSRDRASVAEFTRLTRAKLANRWSRRLLEGTGWLAKPNLFKQALLVLEEPSCQAIVLLIRVSNHLQIFLSKGVVIPLYGMQKQKVTYISNHSLGVVGQSTIKPF
jgi:hypothetical protein